MSHLDVRMPLGEVSANGLTPNTKAKQNENIREQLKERALRMQRDHEQQKAAAPKPEPVGPVKKAVVPAVSAPIVIPKEEVKAVKKEVAPVAVPVAVPVPPIVEKKPAEVIPVSKPVERKPLMAPQAPAVAPKPQHTVPLRGDEVDAPKYKTAAAVVEQKAKNDPPATIEVPQKVVAPGITPPNVPPANPKPAQKEQKRRVLDGQDGITQACLLPPKREKKRGAVPPPNLGGDAPAAAKNEKPRPKPTERAAVPNVRRAPEVARREEVPLERMMERERERFAPTRDIGNYPRDLRAGLPRHVPGAGERHVPAPERHLPGAGGLGAPDLDRLRFGGPLPGADLHRRPYGAHPPAPPRDIHIPGGLPHFPPASRLPGFPGGMPHAPHAVPSALLDDAALARRIAMEEYGW